MRDLSDLITVVVHNPSHDMNVFLGGFFDFKRQGISTLNTSNFINIPSNSKSQKHCIIIHSFCHILPFIQQSTNIHFGGGFFFLRGGFLILRAPPETCLFLTTITCNLFFSTVGQKWWVGALSRDEPRHKRLSK